VARLCHRAIWLDEGVLAAEGTPHDVINAYHLKVGEKEQRERAKRGEIGARWGTKEIEITSARVLGPDGVDRVVLESGMPAAIEIGFRNPKGVTDAVFGVYVYREDGTGVYGTNTLMDGVTVQVAAVCIARFVCGVLTLLSVVVDVGYGVLA